jgi:hypothetical protein
MSKIFSLLREIFSVASARDSSVAARKVRGMLGLRWIFYAGEIGMETREIKDEWIVLEENDPPPDLSREDAAFERERPRLVREHLGKIAVIHGDEVVGPFATLLEAETEAYRRFAINARLIFPLIPKKDEPEWVSKNMRVGLCV